jgi:hypothetical protein
VRPERFQTSVLLKAPAFQIQLINRSRFPFFNYRQPAPCERAAQIISGFNIPISLCSFDIRIQANRADMLSSD